MRHAYTHFQFPASETVRRRHLARKHLKPNEVPFTMTSFPRLGTPGVFTEPYYPAENAVSSHSFFLPEEITNPHARFPSVMFLPMTSPGSTCLLF